MSGAGEVVVTQADVKAARAAQLDAMREAREALEKAVQFEQDFTDGEEANHPWLVTARQALASLTAAIEKGETQ